MRVMSTSPGIITTAPPTPNSPEMTPANKPSSDTNTHVMALVLSPSPHRLGFRSGERPLLPIAALSWMEAIRHSTDSYQPLPPILQLLQPARGAAARTAAWPPWGRAPRTRVPRHRPRPTSPVPHFHGAARTSGLEQDAPFPAP